MLLTGYRQYLILFLFSLLSLSTGWYALSRSSHDTNILEQNYDYIMYNDPIGANADAAVHYYRFVLSWSPDFCQQQRQRFNNNLPKSMQYQCNNTQQFGWVIHGLWPQNKFAISISQHPRFCQGDLAMLPQELIEPYLPYSPSASLLQGEWEKHGSCAFKNARAYFDKARQLYISLKLPNTALTRHKLITWLKHNNPQLKNKYINLKPDELSICYDLDWRIIDCPT